MSQIIIFRNDPDDKAVAIIDWQSNPQVPDGAALKTALTAAVTDWMTNDDYGREVFDEVGDEYNIADLMNEMPGDQPPGYVDTITPYLHKHHVYGLKVNTLDDSNSVHGWAFDTGLVNNK